MLVQKNHGDRTKLDSHHDEGSIRMVICDVIIVNEGVANPNCGPEYSWWWVLGHGVVSRVARWLGIDGSGHGIGAPHDKF